MFCIRILGLIFLSTVLVAGCVARYVPYPYAGRYEIVTRMNHWETGIRELTLATRVIGCRQSPALMHAVNERFELYAPDGKLIQVVQKVPLASPRGSYSGSFTIEFPPSVPAGNYRFLVTLEVNGQTCAADRREIILRGMGPA